MIIDPCNAPINVKPAGGERQGIGLGFDRTFWPVGHLNYFAVPGVGIFEFLFVPVVAIWVQHLHEKAENRRVGAKKAAIKQRVKRSSKQTRSSKRSSSHIPWIKAVVRSFVKSVILQIPPPPPCSWVSCDGCVLWWHFTCLGFDMETRLSQNWFT